MRVKPQGRPWSARIWLTRPQWYWFGWQTLVPFYGGSDEYDWHTVTLGWTVTGRVTFATRPCPGYWGRRRVCKEHEVERGGSLTHWPIPGHIFDQLP